MLRPPACSIATTHDDTVLQTWFERDRAHVCLSRKDADGDVGDTIIEWWDEAVAEAVEDGFLNPRDYHGSAYAYAESHGFVGTRREVDLSRIWPSLALAFVENTKAADRPVDQSERLDWYSEQARQVVEVAVADPQIPQLSPRQTEVVADVLTGALYDMAVSAESRPAPLRLEPPYGPLMVETDGAIITVRGGSAGTGSPYTLAGGVEATFSLIWRHAEGPESGNLSAVFGSPGHGVRHSHVQADRLLPSIIEALSSVSDDLEDFVLATKEWSAFIALEKAIGQGDVTSIAERAYDEARAARAAARIHPEASSSPAQSMG